jgi:hypothetical protein
MAPGSEQLCSDRLDKLKHALLLAEASSPAAVLPAVARLTLAMLRIDVPRGTSSSSSSSNSFSSRLSRMGYSTARQAVYDVAASIASVSARVAASGLGSHEDMFSTG